MGAEDSLCCRQTSGHVVRFIERHFELMPFVYSDQQQHIPSSNLSINRTYTGDTREANRKENAKDKRMCNLEL